MDILEFAMQMELDGKAFYEKGAEAAKSPELKKILQTLAEEEQRHYNIFKQLKAGEVKAASKFADNRAETVTITRNLFREMADAGQDTLYGDEARAMWNEAMEVERKSEKMYREAAEKESDEQRRELWNRIADEENNHIYFIDNMISFLADPQSFVQSAQFRNFMSWEGH